MSDNGEATPLGRRPAYMEGMAPWLRPSGTTPREPEQDAAEEESCPAFGFLRGLRDRALAIEFRFRTGDSAWYPYSWLGPFRHNPSAGLLLKFSGDVVTLVLIRGSNLDALVTPHGINLTDRGLQRHRITYVREMEEDELRKVGEGGPTIDRIEIAEFAADEAREEQRAWLQKHAPAFLREPR
jgi:hypothetical protein